MPFAIHLPLRRYTVRDSIAIAFRCAPVAAFFYAFFDLAWAALTPVTTLVAARLIDAVVRAVRDGAAVEDVYRYLALLAGLTAFGWLRSALHNLADLRLTLALRARYRTALTAKRTRLAYALLEQPDTWDLIQRVAANPEGGRLKETYYHLVDLAAFVLKVAGLLALLATAVWWAPLVVLAVGGLALVLGVRGGRALYQAERQVAAHDRRLDYLSQLLLGREAAAERTLFGSSSMVTGMWRKSFHAALGVRLRARWRWYIKAYAGNLTNQAIWVLLMLALLPALPTGAVSIGLFIALTQAFTRFDIVWGFMDTVNGIAADAEFFKDLTAFLALPEENNAHAGAADAPPAGAPVTPPAAPARIELRDVRFRYPDTERYVLDGLSLTLEAGKRYALVGANGCGKTTVTRLLTGLYPPEAGGIWVNGRNLPKSPPPNCAASSPSFTRISPVTASPCATTCFWGRSPSQMGRFLSAPGLARWWPGCPGGWIPRWARSPGTAWTSPAASGSAWPWPARWRAPRRCASWMNPPPPSTRWRKASCTPASRA
jgi:ATP-binding cassette, subfamily B, bacterial